MTSARPVPPTRQQVLTARHLIRLGNDLATVAKGLRVLTGDLDRALWSYIDLTDHQMRPMAKPRRPPPMF